MEIAIILCEGKFGTGTGKTANGLVRYSQRFKIIGVIDSTKADLDAGEVLDGKRKNIPIFRDLAEALAKSSFKPNYLIIGVATIGGMLPKEFRPVIVEALKNGINVISGLHEYLEEDIEFESIARRSEAKIIDIRKEPPLENLHKFRNKVKDIKAIRIPVLGTDSSVGKRTTAILLTEALNEQGIKATFVATGQTGLLQGAKYGIPLDAIKGDYMVGELEHQILSAYENEKPKIIIIEGQGSISHPAYVCGTRAIIMGSQPNGIILQHAPKRKFRNYGNEPLRLPMPHLKKEIEMLELFSNSKVIALTINHENMSEKEIEEITKKYEKEFGLPTCDVLKQGADKLVNRIKELFV